DRTDLAARVLDHRQDAIVRRAEIVRPPVHVDVALVLPVPPEELERRVAEDRAKPDLDFWGRGEVRDSVDQLPDGIEGGADLGHLPGLYRLPALEARGPLLDEGLDTLPEVVRLAQQPVGETLHLEPELQRPV